MSNQKRTLAHWIDDLIDALKLERQMYGSFGLTEASSNSTSQVANSNKKDDSTDESSTISDSSLSKQESTDKRSSNQQDQPVSQSKPESASQPISVYEQLKQVSTLDELKTLCETAEELQTDLEGTNLVFGVGNPHADLMVIGEAPGYHEDQQGEPFVGKAGQLLDKILSAINFDRPDVYIANILKHRPPNNRDPLTKERSKSLPFLQKQIELIDPKLILCLGRVAATTLLNRDQSLGSMRGKFHPYDNGKRELLVTYHPAALLRNPQWKRPTWEDVQLLRKRYDELGCQP
ncbi:MAG: uracil-DNA glycosylase [Bacteroidota bacterium]